MRQTSLMEWLWHPAVLLYLVVFPLVYYVHVFVIIPRFFARKKYLTYGTIFVFCIISILLIRPLDRMVFRSSLRMPPGHFKHAPPTLPHPDQDAFFFDPTSLGLFLILWFLGLSIWLYQKKFKLLFSILSKQMEAEAQLITSEDKNELNFSPSTQAEEKAAPISEGILTVHVEYEQIKILVEDIEYIEAFDSYVKIYLSNTEKPILTRLTLRAIAEKLPEEKFVRIHRSFMVASNKVIASNSTKIRLKSGVELPVGRRFKDSISLSLANTSR